MLKWTVNKDALEGAIALASAVPTRSGIKSSEFIKVAREGKDGAAFYLSSDMYGKGIVRGEPFPFPHDLFLDRRLFLPFIDNGKELKATHYVFLQEDSGALIIKHGGRKVTFEKAKPIIGYEDAPNTKECKESKLDKQFSDLVDAAKQCATDDPVAPRFNCVYVNPHAKGIDIFAGNGHIVFQGRAKKVDGLKTAIAFPLLLVDALAIDKALKLLWTDKFAMVSFSKGRIWQPVKIQARKHFPLEEAKKTVHEAMKYSLVLKMPAFNMAAIANRIASYTSALSRETLVFSIQCEKGSRIATVRSGAQGSVFEETFKLKKPALKTVDIKWPLVYVMPILLYCQDDGYMRIRISKTGQTCLSTNTVSLVVAPTEKEKKK